MRARLLAVACLTVLLALGVPAQDHGHHHDPHQFQDVQKWIDIFEEPGRDDWQRPAQVVEALHLEKGMTVADIGAGSGYFTRPLAQAVDPGKAWAVEIEQGFLDYIRDRAEREGQGNIGTILAALDDPHLPPASQDLIFICDTVHHFDNRMAYYAHLKRALKPGGRVAIVDFFKDREIPFGPKPAERIAHTVLMEELRQAGFSVEVRLDLLPYQYLVIARLGATGS